MSLESDVAGRHSGDRHPPGDAAHHAPDAAPAKRANVSLIREWEQQMSSSGCCGWTAGACYPSRFATRLTPL